MADIKCDLCNRVVQPAEGGWTYITPSTGTELEAISGQAFWAEDEQWFVCVRCEPDVEKGWINHITLRWAENNVDLIAKSPDYIDFANQVQRGFFANKNGERYYEEIVSPGNIEYPRKADA